MADKENGATPTIAPVTAPPRDVTARELIINAQYIKDLSFENPRAPQSLMRPPQQQPEVQMGIDITAQTLAPNVYEVALAIHAEAKAGSDRVFLVELVYGAVATLNNIPEAEIPLALFVETPRLLFPFVRGILASATRDGGFMPLLINQIDFGDLLRRKQEAMRAQQAPASA